MEYKVSLDRPVTVDILMATYNGGKYIHEQIESLKSQTYPHWRLLVHDDGSTDNTITQIRQAQLSDPRIILLADQIKGLGAARNFLYLLSNSNAPYCMFCDQDDIWMEQKIETMLRVLEQEPGPAAAYANAWFMKEGNVIRRHVSPIHPDTPQNTLFLNAGIQGCSLIMNRKLLDMVLPYPEEISMHDHLITMAAVCFGKIIYIDKPLMYYRQHEANVTGQLQYRMIDHFYKADTRLSVIDRKHYLANQAFYAQYKPRLTSRQQQLFQAYFQYAEKAGYFTRLLIIIKWGFKLGNKKGRLLIKSILRKPIN